MSVLRLVYTTTMGAQVYTTTSRPLCRKRPPVQAPVSGLLFSRIQPMRLPTDPGLPRATKDSSSGLLRDHVLLDPAYMATTDLLL
jgi:hypothetical protein